MNRDKAEILQFLNIEEKEIFGEFNKTVYESFLYTTACLVRSLKENIKSNSVRSLTNSELIALKDSVQGEIKQRGIPAKEFKCSNCQTVFQSRTKKTLCPDCRYEKDKECKKLWARKNNGRRLTLQLCEVLPVF